MPSDKCDVRSGPDEDSDARALLGPPQSVQELGPRTNKLCITPPSQTTPTRTCLTWRDESPCRAEWKHHQYYCSNHSLHRSKVPTCDAARCNRCYLNPVVWIPRSCRSFACSGGGTRAALANRRGACLLKPVGAGRACIRSGRAKSCHPLAFQH